MKEFTLTENHLKLLRHSYVDYDDNGEYFSTNISPLRPYGSKDIVGDILRILGLKQTDSNIDKAQQLHKEIQFALQILLCFAGSPHMPLVGYYRKQEPNNPLSWKLSTRDPDPNQIVSLYRCTSCGKLTICVKGNHHPWCLPCMNDEFDWSTGYENITRRDAEIIMKQEDT